LCDSALAAIVTTGRQDFGILRSTIDAFNDAPDLELRLLVGGMHLRERFGRTIDAIRADGYTVDLELDFVGEPPDPVADSARALELGGAALQALRPDFLVLVGDRSETLAIATAAALTRIPIVHLHGGEETEGAIDNAFRHAITKLSHLHLVSHADHAARVLQLGEPRENVRIVGVPGLDTLFHSDLPSLAAIEDRIGARLPDPVVVVTVHPTTLGHQPNAEIDAVDAAMRAVPATYVVTLPNADEGGAYIRQRWLERATGRPDVIVVDALGEWAYLSLLRRAAAVLGNSSSGLLEATTAGAFTVNVGDRQRGRLRAASVRDVPADPEAIRSALEEVLAAARDGETPGPSPFPPGPAAPRIVEAVREWLPRRQMRKPFVSTEALRPVPWGGNHD
jgi:UDP-hydrolysing UDP-N-acetyl-D-glucosamine 2-epimerase